MQEVKVKTHLIITDIHEEYHMNWCGKLANVNPVVDERGLPKFVIISDRTRVEVNTIDMKHLEKCAKALIQPKGRTAITKDKAYIYIKEVDGSETLLGILTHKRVKSFAPMYDKIGYR